jgi:hypothetical protein
MHRSFGRRVLWAILRGTLLGLSLSAFFPPQPSAATSCICDDWGSGSRQCGEGGGGSSCSPGTEQCHVECT